MIMYMCIIGVQVNYLFLVYLPSEIDQATRIFNLIFFSKLRLNINKLVSCKDPRMQLFLIAVTSRLDAMVACINVLHPMENQ